MPNMLQNTLNMNNQQTTTNSPKLKHSFLSNSAMSPVLHTLSSGVTSYYELPFPSGGATITLDVLQGSVILYASDNVWNANAHSYDWRVTANTSRFIEAFLDPSTLTRPTRSILFLAIVGAQISNTYIINNAMGDITTRGRLIIYCCNFND